MFTSDEDLADVAGTEHGAVVVSDLDFDTRKRTPDAGQALLLDRIVAVLGDTVVVGEKSGYRMSRVPYTTEWCWLKL